jgi:hypothetical protein
MNTLLLLLALAVAFAALVRYVRRDTFASHRTPAYDELGRPALR